MENIPQINSSYILQSSQKFLYIWKKKIIYLKYLFYKYYFVQLSTNGTNLHAVILLFATN